ncbi:MAG: SHOCT domain-containing protein [Saccharofermentanales bacterium]
MMFGFWFLLILGAYLFYRMFDRGNTYSEYSNKNNAMQILNERYAKGEISQDEYLTKKSDLMR